MVQTAIFEMDVHFHKHRRKWVFKTKEIETGNVKIFKSGWLVKGYMQEHSVEYDLIHDPISRISIFRNLFPLADSSD